MPVIQFKGKTTIETYHHTVPHHSLELDPNLSVLPKNEKPSLEGNLIIEGDNLLALKALLPTHAGTVDCVYIDPPYNTGNENWVYNDNLTQPQFKEWIGHVVGKEGEDACRHDKWCCMMWPRLRLLRELLSDGGAIFVSIADHEVHRLRGLMDDIFGEQCFVATFVWKSRAKPSNIGEKKRKPQQVSEYILCYSKEVKGDEKTFGLLTSGEERSYPYELKGRRYRLATVLKSNRGENQRDTMRFEAGGYTPPEDQRWQGGETLIKDLFATGYIEFTSDGVPMRRYFEDEEDPEHSPLYTFIPPELSGTAEHGKIELNNILGPRHGMDTVKPLSLIEWILSFATKKDSIVLDSFAGSGTTGHAVLKLNARDDGKRRFILIQQPFDSKDNEKAKLNICKSITAKRIRAVIEGYQFEGQKIESLMEETITFTTLKNSSELLDRIAETKTKNEKKFDQIKIECKDGVLTVLGIKGATSKTNGLDGSFSYSRLSPNPLYREYRDITKNLPSFEDMAKYIFFTETSKAWVQSECDKKTGKIGEVKKTSYYLLYTPTAKDSHSLDIEFLNAIAAKDPNPRLVIYCEKIWIHRNDLLAWQEKTGKSIRTMTVPFNLK